MFKKLNIFSYTKFRPGSSFSTQSPRCVENEDPPQNHLETAGNCALAWLGFWWELPNRLWNVNFTTITSFPATLNADFFMKQLLLKLCMWCRPLVSLWIKYGSTWHITKPGQNNRYSERKVTLLNDIALMIIENRQEPCYFLHSFSV